MHKLALLMAGESEGLIVGSQSAGHLKSETEAYGRAVQGGPSPVCGKGDGSSNQSKYERPISPMRNIPFSHRIRPCGPSGRGKGRGAGRVSAESERNLSLFEGDDAWIFDDAIACNGCLWDKGSSLFGESVACGNAYVSQNSAPERPCPRGRTTPISGELISAATPEYPTAGWCWTRRTQAVHPFCPVPVLCMAGYAAMSFNRYRALIISGEEICNDSLDTLVMDGKGAFRHP